MHKKKQPNLVWITMLLSRLSVAFFCPAPPSANLPVFAQTPVPNRSAQTTLGSGSPANVIPPPEGNQSWIEQNNGHKSRVKISLWTPVFMTCHSLKLSSLITASLTPALAQAHLWIICNETVTLPPVTLGGIPTFQNKNDLMLQFRAPSQPPTSFLMP